MKTVTLGGEKAIVLYNTKWWEKASYEEIAKLQTTVEESIYPFSKFHESLEKALSRPVYIHELALNREKIYKELMGEQEAPTFKEVLSLIPQEKLIALVKE